MLSYLFFCQKGWLAMRTAILLGKGYEEIEALTVVDYLRRAEIPVDMVSITGELDTIGDHDIHIQAEKHLADISAIDYDMIITPGGTPGAKLLAATADVRQLLQAQFNREAYIASICASPLALQATGISEKITGTCYPGLEDSDITFQTFKEDLIVHDRKHKVITSRGPATAVYFALEIIETLKGKAVRDEIAEGLLVPMVEQQVKASD